MSETTSLSSLLDQIGKPVEGHRPWPRIAADRKGWSSLIAAMAGNDWTLLGLWGEPKAVHVAVADVPAATYAVVSLDCPERSFPSFSAVRPGAIRLERTAQELFGLTAEGLTDPRPWLDYGWWGVRQPLAETPLEPDPNPPRYEFLPIDGEGWHQVPVGPVHAGIIEPGHFRFTCNGETVIRLEERLGWVHKGVDSLLKGATIENAAKLAARLSGDATVANSIAFARAVEAALGIEVPPRAVWLRAMMGELERIANHLGDIGSVCNDAAFAFMLAEFHGLRELVAQANWDSFGHRLMMDRVIPGGTLVDLSIGAATRYDELAKTLRSRVAGLVHIYDTKPSMLDRTVTTGTVSLELVNSFAASGHVGRASGRDFDSRKTPGYPPYDQLEFRVPVFQDGDVNARVWVRIREIEESLKLVEQIVSKFLEKDFAGDDRLVSEVPAGVGGEGIAMAEAFRGEYLAWVRIGADGLIQRCHLRDPSWFQWPVLEASIEGNIVADFPLCNKSFNCSYTGADL
ncbi:MAG: hydrogenase expression protein HypE [Azospirillum sp.]|nr:hydrogenase expression protein HypE [Azospirillum sp.]